MRAVATVPGLYFTVSPPQAEPSPLRSDVAGFIGRTRRGPVGIPIRVEGWRGYQRVFGGLDSEVVMTYSIRGYFENEGEVAHVIRLSHESATQSSVEWEVGAVDNQGLWTAASPVGFEHTSYIIKATSPGRWANNTRITINYRSRGASGRPEVDFAISVPSEPTQYFTAVALAGHGTEDDEGQPQTFAQFINESSRFI